MMTVREIIEKVDGIENVIEALRQKPADIDPNLVGDILEEYRDVLLDKTVK